MRPPRTRLSRRSWKTPTFSAPYCLSRVLPTMCSSVASLWIQSSVSPLPSSDSEVLAVDRFTMNKSELLRSPSAVRAAAKAAWGEMEKARAKRTTPFVPVPFPDFPYDSETELVRLHDHSLSSMSVNQVMPRTILRLVRLCPPRAVSSNETPTPSLSSTTTRAVPVSSLVLQTSPDRISIHPSSVLTGVWKTFPASIWTVSLLTPRRTAKHFFLLVVPPKGRCSPHPRKTLNHLPRRY
jgi:hypothetical protein